MTSLDLPRLAGLIFGAPLMIARPKLDVILDVVTPRLLAGGPMDPVPTDPGDRPFQVTGDGILRIRDRGQTVAELEAKILASPPVYHLPVEEPAYYREAQSADLSKLPMPSR